ncbi:MAG: hypothetical protein JNG88_16140, partial [Phycisphaerales bacterium]|nr:hypothetical protein [Phycisphaerales bacterium]
WWGIQYRNFADDQRRAAGKEIDDGSELATWHLLHIALREGEYMSAKIEAAQRRERLMRRRASVCFSSLCVLGLSAVALSQTTQPVDAHARLVDWPRFDQLNFIAGMTAAAYRAGATDRNAAAFFATPFIWCIASSDARDVRSVQTMTQWVKRFRPDALVGRYYSATTVRTDRPTYFPHETAPGADFSGDDFLPATWPRDKPRVFVNVTRPQTRAKLIAHFISNTRREGFRVIALDNLSQGHSPPADSGLQRPAWDDGQLALLRELLPAAHAEGLRVVINAAIDPGSRWSSVLPHIDGILFEMPLHPNVIREPNATAKELDAYRAALDAGKLVGLVPLGDDERERVANEEICAAAAMLVRKPGEPIAVSPRSWKPVVRRWYEWPALFGEPRGPYRRDGDFFVRDFANRRLTVDFVTKRVQIDAVAR